MKLIVGLGNPGKEYDGTRHNIGFDILDQWGAPHWSKKFQGLAADERGPHGRALLLKPQTFMNLSGQSVGEALRFFKDMTVEDVLVIHDDLDLPIGRARFKKGGGHGGHNGLKSTDAHIGVGYHRLRIGIGHPGDRRKVTNHVLGKFSKAEWDILEGFMGTYHLAIQAFIRGDHDQLRQHLAATKNDVKPEPTKTSKASENKNTPPQEAEGKLALLLRQMGLSRKD